MLLPLFLVPVGNHSAFYAEFVDIQDHGNFSSHLNLPTGSGLDIASPYKLLASKYMI